MTPEMKKSLENVVVALAHEETDSAKVEFNNYLRMKTKELLSPQDEYVGENVIKVQDTLLKQANDDIKKAEEELADAKASGNTEEVKRLTKKVRDAYGQRNFREIEREKVISKHGKHVSEN